MQNAENPPEEDMNWHLRDFTSENSYIEKDNDAYILYYNGEKLLKTTNLENLPDVPYIED